jgi:hypothetical protein
MEKPLFEHDCDKCHFLGTYKDHDLYCCDGLYRTHIARFSSEPSEYYSCSIYILEKDPFYPNEFIQECYSRAKKVPLPLRLKIKALLEKMTIRPARYSRNRERLEMAALHIARVFDMAVFFLSLSFYSSDLYAKLLFGNFMKDDND